MTGIVERIKLGEVLLLDGGLGTELQKKGFKGKNSFTANTDSPALVQEVHLDYIAAGANIIETNTFGASASLLSIPEDKESLEKAVELAKRSAENKAYLAASIGPIGKPVAPKEDYETDRFFISWRAASEVFEAQAELFSRLGIDIYWIETMNNINEARLAADACTRYGLPIALSFAINAETNKTSFGHTITDIVQLSEDTGIDILGINCIKGIKDAILIASELKKQTQLPLAVYPNAGIPNTNGVYPESPAYMASRVPELIELGVNIIGGCCGTTPEYIKAFREVIDN
jgi:5-methyltetrahydrofolate--homocysteine methyltransferase